MPTHLMKMKDLRRVGQRLLGVGPFVGIMPLPSPRQLLQGVSRDSVGAALPSCICTLFKVTTDVTLNRKIYTQMDQTISDPITGAYSFPVSGDAQYRVTYDLDGAPIRAGLTLNTLVGDTFGS